jgi:ubiquinone biosynthesis protein
VRLRVVARLLQIQRVLVRHGLDDFARATSFHLPLQFLFYLSPWTWFQRRRGTSRGERLRLALIELGPMFVKFGQALSTRRDLLPVDIADELAKLQDRVPPFPGHVARAAIERAYGRPLDAVFSRFDESPLAAASVAQVHVATFGPAPAGARGDAVALAGREVIVKVLRPGIRERISRDLEVLHALAELAETYAPETRRLRPRGIVNEYEKTILDELDLMREAANASQIRRNFEGSPLLYVPEVYWDFCRIDVMVMERIHGVQISDMGELRRREVDLARLARNGVEIFFTQVFRHNFFHADMHPGNIFVLVDDPRRPRYAAVDFGIVGTLAPRDQHYLAENFLAVFRRDYRRVATLHVESGWVPADTRVDEMESAVRTVCEPIFDRPLRDIYFGTVLLRLFEISRRFEMQIQPQLILLQKTLLNIEGLGRDLYPDLDIWNTARPILSEWMAERVSVGSVLKALRQQIPELVLAASALPSLVKGAIQRAQDGTLRLPIAADLLEAAQREVLQASRRRDAVTIAAVLVLGGIVWLALGRSAAWPGWVLVGVGTAWLLGLIRR